MHLVKEHTIVASDTEEIVIEKIETGTSLISQLIVYNDDVNTFDWVIKCLIEICSHSNQQAEQLSLIVHFKGKAIVKSGAMEVLKPMKDALCERGLSAVIESTTNH